MTITTKPLLACKRDTAAVSPHSGAVEGLGRGGGTDTQKHAAGLALIWISGEFWLITEWSVTTAVLKSSCGQSGVPSASD